MGRNEYEHVQSRGRRALLARDLSAQVICMAEADALTRTIRGLCEGSCRKIRQEFRQSEAEGNLLLTSDVDVAFGWRSGFSPAIAGPHTCQSDKARSAEEEPAPVLPGWRRAPRPPTLERLGESALSLEVSGCRSESQSH